MTRRPATSPSRRPPPRHSHCATWVELAKYFPKLYNMAVLHHAALRVAGRPAEEAPQVFDPRLVVHEDVDLGLRLEQAGGRLVGAPEVRVRHYRDTTFFSFVGRNFHLGRACRMLGVHRLPQTALAGFALTAALLAVLAVFFPFWRLVFLVYVAIYGTIAVIGSVRTCGKQSIGLVSTATDCMISLHLARGLGYVCAWSHRRHTVPQTPCRNT